MRIPLRDAVAAVAALFAPFVVALALAPVRADVSHTNVALVLVVAVVAVSALGNRYAGALAALSAAAWFDFFHTVPYETFHIEQRADIETALLLLVVGLAVSQLAARARLLGGVALADAGHLERLHETARFARFSTSPDDVAAHVRRQLVELLGLRACRFERGSLLGHPARLEQDGSVTVPDWVWDLDRQGWPEGEIELRATSGGHYEGRFMMTPVPGAPVPPLEARLVAVTLAAQAAVALEAPAPVGSRG
ncbi:DUF4118 domain-containing protein [Streptomyces sp. NPDC059456]|uniref:DUF4118 domain-containing protein n=1 Tax=Streptomyces sp. NPDC059456 TaxID=3346838 RepID=UPI00367B5649